MSKLTEKQQQIYDFILDFSQEHGLSPSSGRSLRR